MKDRGPVDMQRQQEIISEADPQPMIGEPCGTCAYGSVSNCPAVYCEKGHGWQSPTARSWRCEKHTPREGLLGLLAELAYHLEINKRAHWLAYGKVAGTVHDLRTPEPPKPPRKTRKKK